MNWVILIGIYIVGMFPVMIFCSFFDDILRVKSDDYLDIVLLIWPILLPILIFFILYYYASECADDIADKIRERLGK